VVKYNFSNWVYLSSLNVQSLSGSTCTGAHVLTKGITEGCKFLAAGMNAMDLRRGTSMASDVAVVNLKHMERMISDSEEIAQVTIGPQQIKKL
jgi:chaperonin GroEL (HSP60 family)